MKLTIEKNKCIGCGSCAAVCPDFFEITEAGKSHLKNSSLNQDENEELELLDAGCCKEASEICPVQCIMIN